jgi:hypothetical protein
MNTSTQKRITRFSGLLLLAVLVVALDVTAAQAMRDFSAGTGGSSTSAVSGTGNSAQRQIGSAWGYYYSPAGRAAIAQRQTGFAWGYYSGIGTINARQLHALLQRSSNVAQRQTGFAWGYYSSGVSTNNARQLHALLQRPTLAQLQKAHDGPNAPYGVSGGGTVSAAQSASSGTSSTTVWIAAAAVLGAVFIGGWALLRRRNRREEARDCELSVAGC